MQTPKPARPERQPADDFERRFGVFGAREIRTLPIVTDEIRDSGAGGGQFTVRGHAAVFDSWSLDLGFFREKIAPGAFDDVLARNPDVWMLWDHDTRWTLARTNNKTLELRTDPRGLHYWGRVAPTSYAEDLRVLMERGDIDQASFAFTIAPGGDEWVIRSDEDGNEEIERTIHKVGDLFDVTITAMGAYPQTDSQVVRMKLAQYEPIQRTLETLPTFGPLIEGLHNRAASDDPAGADASRSNAEAVNEQGPSPALVALRARSRRFRALHS